MKAPPPYSTTTTSKKKRFGMKGFNCLLLYLFVLCRQVYHFGLSTLDVVLIRS